MGSAKKVVSGSLVLIFLVLGIYLLISKSGSSSVQSKDGISVVAAENFWGNIAEQIGGKRVHVTSIVTDPTADPHLYESNAQNASVIASADVVIVNGLGYDEFMNKLLAVTKSSKRTVLNASQLLDITEKDANPHLWYDISHVHDVASSIASTYEAKDPTNKAEYQHNLITFDQSLQPLLKIISTIKMKYANSPVAYTERVPGYLLTAAGLDVKTPLSFASAIQDGIDPSPADTTTMESLMLNKNVKVLMYNSQATSPVTQHIRDLASRAGLPIVAVTETLPASEKTYQSWQQDQLNNLLEALKKN